MCSCSLHVSFQGLAAAPVLVDGWCNSSFLSTKRLCVSFRQWRRREGDVAEWSLAWMFALQGGWLLGNGSVFVLFLERITAGEHNRSVSHTHTCLHTPYNMAHTRNSWMGVACDSGERCGAWSRELIYSDRRRAIEMWMMWPTAPPWTWNLHQPSIFIVCHSLTHRLTLYACAEETQSHTHTHRRSSETSCSHSLHTPTFFGHRPVMPCVSM